MSNGDGMGNKMNDLFDVAFCRSQFDLRRPDKAIDS